jgi:hypothetical protein
VGDEVIEESAAAICDAGGRAVVSINRGESLTNTQPSMVSVPRMKKLFAIFHHQQNISRSIAPWAL